MSMTDKILVLGDTISDIETVIKSRASLEEPKPEYGSWEVVSSIKRCGGAANVGRHLNNLARNFVLFPTYQYFEDTVKQRFFDKDGKKLLKLNTNSDNSFFLTEYHEAIESYLSTGAYNKIVIVDMERKAITDKVAKIVMASGKQVFVDIQKRFAVEKIDFSPWNGATIFPNSTELAGINLSHAGSVYSKLGSHGVEYYDYMTDFTTFEAGIKLSDFGYEVFDTVGAGDAFLAAVVAGGSVEFANRYAAFSITKQANQWYHNENQYMLEFSDFERKVLGK